jgi:aminocarboxymuconate-semialdehyde decarboxylase
MGVKEVIVDSHAHIVPQKFFDAAKKLADQLPSVKLTETPTGYTFSFANGKTTRPVTPKLIDTQSRLQWMDSQGIDHQVVGGWLDFFGYELPDQEGLLWSRLINQQIWQDIKDQERITGLATVPMQCGKLAAQVLNEALDMGFVGAMIGTQPKGEGGNLDDADLDAFWEVASNRGAVIFIHPMFVCGDDRLTDFELIQTVGRTNDTTVAIARLLSSGHILKYSGVKIILSHGGGSLPYVLGRLIKNHTMHPSKVSDPHAGMKQLYFDTVVFDPAALKFLVGKFGSERVLMGSDYPFALGDLEPRKVVESADLDQLDLGRVLGKNAAQIFNIKQCSC